MMRKDCLAIVVLSTIGLVAALAWNTVLLLPRGAAARDLLVRPAVTLPDGRVTGFAGVRTGEPVTPISKPRGYPADFVSEGPSDDGESCEDMHPIASLDAMDPRRRKWHTEGEPMSVWMGDHSHSWLTADEMLAWYANAPTVVKVGILSRSEYEAWDKTTAPESYCGGVSGPGVVIVNDNAVEREQTPGWTYIRCEWHEILDQSLRYFFDEVARLKAEHGHALLRNFLELKP